MKLLLIIIFSAISIWAQDSTRVKTGLDVLESNGFNVFQGKRVGLITNPTGINARLQTNIDIFFKQKNVNLSALYGPEHGVRGDIPAGKEITSYNDPVTGIPVYSLYGKTRKPTREMIEDIDVLVYDIQDIGCRSYTYISTMGLAMEAAAEYGKAFIVLDRPNPLGGVRVEGSLAKDGFFSFVSQFPIPYVYGLTCGELAKFLNDEVLAKKGLHCDLTVVPMQGWKRSMVFQETGLPWVLTSPHVPNPETAFFYVASGILGELGVISEGVGTTLPFQLFAAEWIDAKTIAERLNGKNLPGVIFRPLSIKPFYGKNKDKDLYGVQIHITDFHTIRLMDIQFHFLEEHAKLYPDKNPFQLCEKGRISMFDKVCGSDSVRLLFGDAFRLEDISIGFDKEAKAFRENTKKYFLY